MDKIYYVFAGVNGAGKSTLYRLFSINYDISGFGRRINTDEIVNKIGNWRNGKDQIKAAKLAINMRKECINKGEIFNQETTLTGNTILKAIKEIKENGYKIKMFYVGVESPDISKERIKKRVAKGGHHIADETVEKRYIESLENFEKIVDICDDVVVYDNSKEAHRRCFQKRGEKIEFSIDKKELPEWIKRLKFL